MANNKTWNFLRCLCIACAAIAAIAGCASAPPPVPWPTDEPADQHVVAINGRGQTVSPTSWQSGEPTTQPIDPQLTQISSAMDRWYDAQLAKDPHARRKILIFVHGGVANPADSLDRSRRQTGKISDAGYFPLFIVWNPGLWSCWGEHVDHVRRGEYVENDYLLAPFYLFADFFRAVARFPIIWTFEATDGYSRIAAAVQATHNHNIDDRWLKNSQFQNAIQVTDALISEYASTQPSGPDTAMRVSLGRVYGNPQDPLFDTVRFVAVTPARLLLGPVLDAGGSSAWDIMYRRADILFDGFNTSSLLTGAQADSALIHPEPGPLMKLIETIARKQAEHHSDAGGDWEITLVGHSMGAIVLNEFVRRSDHLQIKNIVYMAAACSVRDFQRTIVEYMSAQSHRDTNFFNLSLHPVNEVREMHADEIVPRGSLLVWIDNMFANPYTPLDRTLGRWENIVQTVYVVPEDIRNRVHLKGFPAFINMPNGADNPQEHGDFSDLPYWEPSIWQPDDPRTAYNEAYGVRVQANIHRKELGVEANTTRPAYAPATQP